MIRLDKTLRAWGTPEFGAVFKYEIGQIGAELLPLQRGLSTGNYVANEPITVTINNVAELEHVIRVKAGIFFRGVIGGCSCADDPAPASETNEYCELLVDIDKATAASSINLVVEQTA